MARRIVKVGRPPLHRVHAAPTGGNSLDVAGSRWRAEEGDYEHKRAVARRLCVAWNVLEGIPTEAIEAGCIRDFHEAVDALLESVDCNASVPELHARAAVVRARLDAYRTDTSRGRLHDCDSCVARGE